MTLVSRTSAVPGFAVGLVYGVVTRLQASASTTRGTHSTNQPQICALRKGKWQSCQTEKSGQIVRGKKCPARYEPEGQPCAAAYSINLLWRALTSRLPHHMAPQTGTCEALVRRHETSPRQIPNHVHSTAVPH